MQLSFLSLIYFIAFSHATFIAVALWRQTEKGHSGRLLALLIGVLGYKMFEGGVVYSSLYSVIPHTIDWLPGVVLIMGPLFYGYIRSVSGEPSFNLKQWLLHLTPAVLLIIYNSPEVFVSASIKISRIQQFKSFEGPMLVPWSIVILLIALKVHLTVYLSLSWRMLSKFEHQADQLRADNSSLILTRHKQLCLALMILEAIWVVLFLLQQTADVFALDYVSKSWLLFMAVIILSIGYYGLKQPSILFSDIERELINTAKQSVHGPVQPAPALATMETTSNLVEITPANKELPTEKYQLSSISDSASKEIVSVINKALKQDQLFLDDKLTLTSLSEALTLKPHMVSQVINQSMQTNFYQLVNQHRVEYAIQLLTSEQNDWSIERIAYESGFGNRVTFNNAFKTLKGCSPSVYRKQLKKTG